MNSADGFKKAPVVSTMSVREAVTKYGDGWRTYVGRSYARGCDLVTFDGLEAVSMVLMERGVSPRIRAMDL